MHTCLYCGTEFTDEEQKYRRGYGLFCSFGCAHYARQGILPESLTPKHHHGGRYLRPDGYVDIYVGKHRSSSGYILEHRLVMEKHLGRPLTTDEHVHHKDGQRDHNDISNLELIPNAEHQRLHAHPITRSRKVPVTCALPGCGLVRMVKLSRSTGEHYCGNEHRLEAMHIKAREYHASQRALNQSQGIR